jgi:hypothetical protein
MKIVQSLKRSWVVWVWRHTPNCAEMSRLASRALDQPLPFGTRLKMRLHFLICAWCHRYFNQLKFMHQAGAAFDQRREILPDQTLSDEALQRMVRRLKIAAEKNL